MIYAIVLFFYFLPIFIFLFSITFILFYLSCWPKLRNTNFVIWLKILVLGTARLIVTGFISGIHFLIGFDLEGYIYGDKIIQFLRDRDEEDIMFYIDGIVHEKSVLPPTYSLNKTTVDTDLNFKEVYIAEIKFVEDVISRG